VSREEGQLARGIARSEFFCPSVLAMTTGRRDIHHYSPCCSPGLKLFHTAAEGDGRWKGDHARS